MKNPLVVGYKGEIGSFILSGLLKVMPKATNIWCFDVNDTYEDKVDRIKKSDVIFLCLPLHMTHTFFHVFKEFLHGKTVIEQTSLKSVLYDCENFKNEMKGIKLLSMHILFRPSATFNTDEKTVVLVDRNKWMKSHLTDVIELITQARLFYVDNYKEHDKMMAFQQTLVHRVIQTLNDCLGKYGNNNTFICKRINEMVKRIEAGDNMLYEMIQRSPYQEVALAEFQKRLDNRNAYYLKESKKGDLDSFFVQKITKKNKAPKSTRI